MSEAALSFEVSVIERFVMNDWLGPSAIAPRASDEQLSKAFTIGSPSRKFFRVFGAVCLWMLFPVVLLLGNFVYETLKYGPNGKQRR